MKVVHEAKFAELLQNFFTKRLIQQRNVSACTVASYRDTFRLLLHFLNDAFGKQPSQISLEDLRAPVIEAFLHYLEIERGNSIRTRNNRFAAIRTFLVYAAAQEPCYLSTIQQVLAMPMKRFDRPRIEYLSRDEIAAIIEAADGSTWSGRRDQVMFSTLYNTGARVSEIVAATVKDVSLEVCSSIQLHGKGRKDRSIPLWKDTARQLRRWIKETDAQGNYPLFPNCSGAHLTRSGVEYRLRRLVATASSSFPSLKNRKISPHTIRHTTAMHLLQSDVDITVIALWLGHESTAITHMYVEADIKMKERALAKVQEPKTRRSRYKPTDKLLHFLETL
ncbi:tyrosine-type recombinase/integrase [Pontiella sulfatireligans]|uniref:Tyrosine recombinase XerC n=1 Tax=Pontiella sulfatireligans TaxID=2750658 RepID=A0A6C2UJS5_9BACT|nr:tyrosine-type recombinase/integrase [Pontiella sulfatireligans]VGO19564.1 Tyrosine recombinase XerC [Pontiella sulfatireligans]